MIPFVIFRLNGRQVNVMNTHIMSHDLTLAVRIWV